MSAANERTPPLLRWAGGKRWLVGEVLSITADLKWNRYHEPFLGGGSIFFGLNGASSASLSDLNADLIETYREVKENPGDVAKLLLTHENTSEHYYTTRAQVPTNSTERAARFIFLNHTSFNGIYRVNLKGVYNVPYGNRAAIRLPDLAQLCSASHRLQAADLRVADFAATAKDVGEGDLVFLDPPYTVAHNNNGFVKYNEKIFSFDDQKRLSVMIDEIRRRNAYYIMTNAAHVSIAELFEKGDRRISTSRRNSIGGVSAVRGSASEYMFTNIPGGVS